MGNKIIKTYDSIVDENGDRIRNLFYLIINVDNIAEDGSINEYNIGNMLFSNQECINFIVDHNIREQMEGLRVVFTDNRPRLMEKEDYEFIENEEIETEEDRKIRELEEQLKLLKEEKEREKDKEDTIEDNE